MPSSINCIYDHLFRKYHRFRLTDYLCKAVMEIGDNPKDFELEFID